MSSKKLKGISETSRKLLEEIIKPFMPIETRIRSKTLVLTEKTTQTINKANSAAKYANKEKIPIPKSTWMIIRHGSTVQDLTRA